MKTAVFICFLVYFAAAAPMIAQTDTVNPLDVHFVRPLAKYDSLRYPPVKTEKELYDRINRFMIDIDDFPSAYKKIRILSSIIEGNKLQVRYTYKRKVDTAFAYYKPAIKNQDRKIGIAIIPGTGINQSSEILIRNDRAQNYQSNIDDISQNYGDVYILVKPNEDFLAIHNGHRKIYEESFVNHLLNNGSSYSAYYLIQSLALSKYLKQRYDELFVCGLSQGGLAAFLNALQSEPDKAVIASGFSILMEKPYPSGPNQLIIPGYNLFYTNKRIKELVKKSPTHFLFSWGKDETGIYGEEAKEGLTQTYFADLPNVHVNVHPGGHEYDGTSITSFFDQVYPKPHKGFQNFLNRNVWFVLLSLCLVGLSIAGVLYRKRQKR